MIGWLIALAIIVLLAILPLGVSAIYDTGGPKVRLILGPYKLILFPKDKKENLPKIDSIDDKPSAIQARLKIAEVRRR